MTATPLYATPRTPGRKTMVGPAVKIAKLLGLDLMEWQRNAVELFTEMDERGFYAFSDCTLLVPRQNGKSTLLLILLLVRCLGTPGSRCGYGAQDLKSARKMLLEVWVPLLDASALKGSYKVRSANGSESIRFALGNRAARQHQHQGPARPGLRLLRPRRGVQPGGLPGGDVGAAGVRDANGKEARRAMASRQHRRHPHRLSVSLRPNGEPAPAR